MRICVTTLGSFVFLTAASAVYAQTGVIPRGDANPVLRVEAGGPTSLVNTMAFSPDGRTLYTAGWDKVVRVWRLDAQGQWWQPAPAFRVPLGPGADGKINTIALSPDGNWLAVAGSSAVRARAGFRDVGIVVPSVVMSTAMREDQGVIYVFNVNTRTARVLRGLRGPVFALVFAAPQPGAAGDDSPPLVAVAREQLDKGGYGGVVWLWDTAKGTHQAWPAPLPDIGPMGRPGVATWRSNVVARSGDRATTRSGDRATTSGLHVALAWEDGMFRVWDVARGKDGLMEQKDAKYNVTVAALPGQQGVDTPRSPARFLSGGSRQAREYLQEWKISSAGLKAASQTPDVTRDATTRTIPLALTLMSSQPGKTPDHAAVAVYVQEGKQSQIRLHLLDMDPAQFGAVKVDILLWPLLRSLPTLAAVPGGKYLAISDLEDQEGHGILVYDIADLLAKKSQAQPWRLSGVGETFRSVSFVRGAKGLGLHLNDKAKQEPGTPPLLQAETDDLFFDFTKPGFVAGGNWKPDTPDLTNWSVRRQVRKVGEQEQSDFQIDDGSGSTRITLAVGQRVTDYALLPPTPLTLPSPPDAGGRGKGEGGSGRAHKMALLAVGIEQLGEPALLLYDAGSGKLIRQFTGHDDTIRSLAFSADGRLLASAADDQTVCLWSLADLPQILGKHGLLTGIAVKDHTKGSVAVARVDKGISAADKLAAGDVIEGFVVRDKLKPVTSARAFYTAVWDRKPGTRVIVQVAGKGRIELPVDQAVDERQPLLTLFSTRAAPLTLPSPPGVGGRGKGEGGTRGGKAGVREWIAWNPQGPYTDSGRPAESLLGWHINTGKPDTPTSFAKAGAYRARYYKEGLLGHLVKHAALAPALEDLKKEEDARLPPDPRVLVRIGDEVLDLGRADDKGYIAVPPRQLVAHVKVDDLPAEMVQSVALSVDGGNMRPMEPASATEWSGGLPAWQAGKHTLSVLVRTLGGRRPAYTVGPLKIRLQSPPQVAKTPDLLPLASVVFLPRPEGLTFYDEGKGPPDVMLRFQMRSSSDLEQLKGKIDAVVLVNGERQAAAPAIDLKARELTVKFKPRVRDSAVQVRLSAPGAEPRTSEPVNVEYLRLPYGIAFLKAPPESEKPEIELVAHVQSSLPIHVQDVKARVMDRLIQNVAVEKQDEQTWLIRLEHVSLDGAKGSKNNIRLDVANADGKCRTSAQCSVIYRGPPPKRADVAILAPATGLNVTEPSVNVRFRVSTESALQHVALVNEVTQTTQPVELSTLKPSADGLWEGNVNFSLTPGVNRLHVVARNEAGDQPSQTAVVSFLPPPVRVLLDHVEPLEGGPMMALQTRSDGHLSPTVPQGRLLLHGRVLWSQDRDDRLKAIERLVVRVNGVQQVDPVRLQPPTAEKPRERAFQVRVFLSQADSNRLEIDLPSLPQEDADRKVHLASCARPVPAKRMLHLLIIGIGEKDESSVKSRVLAALGATSIHGNEFSLPAFDQAVVYGPLVDSVRPVERTDVFGKFLTIRNTMDALAHKDLYTHVVMVYYQGNEVVSDKGYFLRTSGPEIDPSLQFYRIPFDNLEKLITDSRGAQLLLMDVARESGAGKPAVVARPDEDIQLFADSHAAIMRYAQLGKGPPAPQSSLIGALEGSLRKASRLGQVEELIAERFDQLRKVERAPLLYNRYIPPSLADLVIGPAVK